MHSSTRSFVDALDAKGIKYIYTAPSGKSTKDIVKIVYGGDNMSSIELKFFFSDDSEDVAVRVFDIVKVPSGREAVMLRAVNEQNSRFRFAKFCLDTDDNTIQMEMDAAFRRHDVGEICTELLARGVKICDDAYPELMKAMWS